MTWLFLNCGLGGVDAEGEELVGPNGFGERMQGTRVLRETQKLNLYGRSVTHLPPGARSVFAEKIIRGLIVEGEEKCRLVIPWEQT